MNAADQNPPLVRRAAAADAAVLPGVEASAGESFRALPDLAWIADDEVGGEDIYPVRIAEGTLWVAEDAGAVVGFLSAQRFGDELHIWELAVAQAFQRRGLGRLLLDAARRHAQAAAMDALTLTTFRHVPWNAPLYARYGFIELRDADCSARLREALRGENARGLPNRCAMRFKL